MISLDTDGAITDLKLEPSVIKSKVKGIYSEVNRIFSGNADAQLQEKYREVIPTLKIMHELYEKLDQRSKKRGAVELSSDEAEIILNEHGEPTDIVKRTRGDAEKMIEQFMLTANEAVATYLKSSEIPCVYRVHEAPDPEKTERFITYVHNLGFKTDMINKNKCDGAALSALLAEAEERGIAEAISYACLRSMAKAEYSDVNKEHFGLGIKNYCHFTSPIRRLSDLITHRIIHRVILEGKPAEKYRSMAKRAAAAATDGEQRADTAERRIDDLYKAVYMRERIGEEFSGMVSSITSFGCFVTLPNTCEGLVPISTLDGFIYDEGNVTLRSSADVIRIGDTVTIRVEDADVSRGKLLFSITERAQ
jgi:ribonuclease R